jgi:hypothetical protein
LKRLKARLDVHRTSTSSPSGHEFEVLKAKRAEPASADDVERLEEVEALKEKLAGNVAAPDHDTTSLDVLKKKSGERVAPSASTPAHDELEILKAKLGKPSGLEFERPDEVQALKAKTAGNSTATEGETTAPTVGKTKFVERGAPTETLPRGGFGVASVKATPAFVDTRVRDGAVPRRRSAFDLAFALVIALWALAVALALTTGAEWWFFGSCIVVTTAVALFGLLASSGVREERGQN